MKAGFAKVCVTPPVGCYMEGLGVPVPSTGIHDDLFVRVLHLSHDDQEALIIGCDLLFFERRDVDRFKGAIGRATGLAPDQILLNVSHNHGGPRLTNWAYGVHGGATDPVYIEQVEAALVKAAVAARNDAQEVSVWAGMARTDLPRSRRKPDGTGKVVWKPYKRGIVCDALPICMLRTPRGKVVALLFSVSCHPSMWYEPQISADYPGVAQRRLSKQFKTEGAIFLQGAGGDSKPHHVGDGDERWRHGKWEEIEAAGRDVADAVIARVKKGLTEYAPEIRIRYQEMHWPLQGPPSKRDLQTVLADPNEGTTRKRWAADMLNRLERFGSLPQSVPVGLHAVQVARGVRFIGLEGESVAELGNLTLTAYSRGVTFPLGYTNGTQLYLTVSHMHAENGYEVDSFYEYHWPAPLAEGEEVLVGDALTALQESGAIPNDEAIRPAKRR